MPEYSGMNIRLNIREELKGRSPGPAPAPGSFLYDAPLNATANKTRSHLIIQTFPTRLSCPEPHSLSYFSGIVYPSARQAAALSPRHSPPFVPLSDQTTYNGHIMFL